MTFTLRLYGYVVAGLLLALALVFLYWGLFVRPAHLKEQRDAARMEATAGRSAVGAGKDVGIILQQGAGREARIDKEVRDAVEAIGKMPDERRDGAAFDALCLRDEYRDAAACAKLR